MHTDIFIIGGGINGTGIAADAAARGLSIILCEQDDLAHATSSNSTKLIHGGLRYLEYYEFRLVREALKEREVLLQKAPHIISPMQFVLPHNKALKPAWMIKLGLFLYDHLSQRHTLPASKSIQFNKHAAGKTLQSSISKGFIYADCWVDDARLVILNAIAAQQQGAQIFTRTRFVNAKRQSDHWEISIEDTHTHQIQTLTAKTLVNAAGPWVDDVIKQKLQLTSKHSISLVKGSHMIVPKLYQEDFAFILPNTDNRVVFIIPYLQKYSLIGTTDIPYTGDPNQVHITDDEITYLCSAVNKYIKQPISANDVIASYSGVRPLQSEDTDSPSAITRDYTLELNAPDQQPALLSIFGGKITTYRQLSLQAVDLLQPFLNNTTPSNTANTILPGGDINDIAQYINAFARKHVFLPHALVVRWVKTYGTCAEKILSDATNMSDLGELVGGDLYEKEVQYLIENEWAQTAEDILWRRTKLGMRFSEVEVKQLHEILRQAQDDK